MSVCFCVLFIIWVFLQSLCVCECVCLCEGDLVSANDRKVKTKKTHTITSLSFFSQPRMTMTVIPFQRLSISGRPLSEGVVFSVSQCPPRGSIGRGGRRRARGGAAWVGYLPNRYTRGMRVSQTVSVSHLDSLIKEEWTRLAWRREWRGGEG